MPSLKDIKRRIKSVKSTQKITQAMYMIATTKFKKAENRVKKARPFSCELKNTLQRLLPKQGCIMPSVKAELAINNFPALMEKREVKNVGIIVVGSNKGLSGPYVTNVARAAAEKALELKNQNIGTKLFVIGTRTYNALKRNPNVEILKYYNKLTESINTGETAVIAEDVAEAYINKDIDAIEILTTEFVSRISNVPKFWALLPLACQESKEESTVSAEFIIEPSPEEILMTVFPMYLTNIIYQARIEAYASELASKMTAMSSATDNADDMIQQLTLKYNKARQSTITQEILEVVSGADALK